MDWCTKNAYSQDLTDNIGRCILKAAKIPCTKTASVGSRSLNRNQRYFLVELSIQCLCQLSIRIRYGY